MQANRYGEQSPPPFRSRRLYSANGQWFFDTRESEQFGPFLDQEEAKKALAVFIAQKLRGSGADRSGTGHLRHGSQDGIEYMVDELSKFINLRSNQGQTAALAWANRRLKVLADYGRGITNAKDRMEALQYAMNQE